MSIETELALLANTKESLRVAIGLSTSIPFSQYKNYIYDIPSAGEFYDFVKNRFFSDGETRSFSDMPSQFTRLSSATLWEADNLIDVPENTPRINNDGLLIEPQRTNLFPNSVITTGSAGVIPTTLEVGEGNVVPAVRFLHGSTTYSYVNILRPNPCIISAYVKNSDNSKPTFTGGVTAAGNDFVFLVAGSAILAAGYTVSKRGDVYRVSGITELTEAQGNTGIVKYAGNSTKDVTATYRQIEAGGTLTSLIKSSGSPTTRAKETIIVPFATGQTVTADKDAGVTMTIVDNDAVFEGHGYIRSIEVN